MNKTLYRQFTPSSRPRKRHKDTDRLTTGAAIAFMGAVILGTAAIFYAVAAEWDCTESLITGPCGKWFFAMLIIGAVDIIFGAWVMVSSRKMPETDGVDEKVEHFIKKCERR